MTAPQDGGPAFPAPEYLINKELDQKTIMRLDMTLGMTLRDYFAAQAMQGMCAGNWPITSDPGLHDMTQRAYAIADALLKARHA